MTDFRALTTLPTAMHVRPYRHGVAVVVLRTSDMPLEFLQAVMDWRFTQYQAAGFYETGQDLTGEDTTASNLDDVHALAIDADGGLAAYVTAKRPGTRAALRSWMFRDRDRPLYPAEEVHGRAWQRSVIGVDDVPLRCTWELGRFMSDRARAKTSVTIRGVLELGLAGAWMLNHTQFGQGVELVLGDVDPNVAMRNLQDFFVPTAAFPEHAVTNQDDTPLAPRYRKAQTAPIVFAKRDLKGTTHARWHDIDLALAQPDEQALPRLLALRSFRFVGESSLRRPVPPQQDGGFPIDALVVADAREAAKVMCRAADRHMPGWSVARLSPGDVLEPGMFAWVVDGFATTRIVSDARVEHLATLGPQVAFTVPDSNGLLGRLVTSASTPMRVLVSDAGTGQAFLEARKRGFDAPAEVLYGDE